MKKLGAWIGAILVVVIGLLAKIFFLKKENTKLQGEATDHELRTIEYKNRILDARARVDKANKYFSSKSKRDS